MNFLLHKKGMGVLAVVIYALIMASYVTNVSKELITEYSPVFKQEASAFLPITIENGKIVSPTNTVISRQYGGEKGFAVVLDTRSDNLETSNLKTGFYISRNNIYSVSRNKIEIKSLSILPNMVIDNDVLSAFTDTINDKAGVVVFAGTFVAMSLWAGIAILLYTIVMHWLMKIVYKVPFRWTLRVNTFSYVIFSAIGLVFNFNLSTVVMLCCLLAVNAFFWSIYKKNAGI